MGVSFVTVYKMAESVVQQMRNCVCKTQTATTGTRPPLVASQYIKTLSNVFCDVLETCLKRKFVSRETRTLHICFPSQEGFILKLKNLLLLEHFLSFRSKLQFRMDILEWIGQLGKQTGSHESCSP